MKILQLCYKIPYPLLDGGEYSLYHSAMSLLTQPGINVKTLAIHTPKFQVNPADIPAEFAKPTDFEFADVDTRVKPYKAFLNLFTSDSYIISRFHSRSFADRINELLDTGTYDIVLLEHLCLCVYLPEIRKHSKAMVVLRAQNVEYSLWKRYIANHRNLLTLWYLKIAIRRLQLFEYEMTGQVDGIIALTDQDKVELQSPHPSIPCRTIPIGFDFSRLRDYNFETQFLQKPSVYHLGSMDWLPNIQGIKWFIDNVLPILTAKRPGIEIHLAGKNMPVWLYKYQSKNLIIDGQVPDSLIYQSDKPVLIVPLLSGSGIRVKIIEGLALGKTIISTSLGATGIDIGPGNPILIADNAASFAECIIRCVDSPDFLRKSSVKARELAYNHYSLETPGKATIDFFNELLKGSAKTLTASI